MERGTYGLKKWIKQSARHICTRINKKNISYFITPGINTYSFYQSMGIRSEKLIRCVNASEVTAIGGSERRLREELEIGSDHKVVLYFGRLEKYKGIYELLSAFSKLNNDEWHLIVCGPGEDLLANYKDRTKNIHVMGSIKPEERADYYSAADLFVLPNTYKEKIEPWGLTVNEAMSFSLPILASNATGSAVDLVFSGVNGYVINAACLEKELEYYISKILSDECLAKSMGQKSKEIIENYTFDNMARAFCSAIEKGLLEKRK